MSSSKKKTLIVSTIESVHLFVYLMMVSAVFFTLYCGIVGYFGWSLYFAIALVAVEGIVLIVNRCECPLATLAKKYGAEESYVFKTFLSARSAYYLLLAYNVIFVVSLILLFSRWLRTY